MTSLSSALPARAAPEGRLIVRHSALVRVCHWVNAICFVVLLMSGMQIFNASPLLTWGQTTNFDRPFFSLSARHDDDGNADRGPNDDLRTCLQHDRRARRLARRRRRAGRAWLSRLGDAAVVSGSGDGTTLAFLLRLDSGPQRAPLFREPYFEPPHPRSLAEPRRSESDPACDRRTHTAPVSLRRRGAALQRAAEARVFERRDRLPDPHPRGADHVARGQRGLPVAPHPVPWTPGGARRAFPAGGLPRSVPDRASGDGGPLRSDQQHALHDHRPLSDQGVQQ